MDEDRISALESKLEEMARLVDQLQSQNLDLRREVEELGTRHNRLVTNVSMLGTDQWHFYKREFYWEPVTTFVKPSQETATPVAK